MLCREKSGGWISGPLVIFGKGRKLMSYIEDMGMGRCKSDLRDSRIEYVNCKIKSVSALN